MKDDSQYNTNPTKPWTLLKISEICTVNEMLLISCYYLYNKDRSYLVTDINMFTESSDTHVARITVIALGERGINTKGLV